MARKPIERPIPEEIIPMLKWCFTEALRDELQYAVKTEITETTLFEGDTDIHIQYHYYAKYNKCFIEYAVGTGIMQSVDNYDNFRSKFENYMNQNFKFNTNIWHEIIINDHNDHKKISGTMQILTPFTIGYFKCLDGNYGFIYDKQAVINDSRAFIPVLDNPPAKKINDYFNSVAEIRERYKQTELSKEEQEEYYSKYVNISKQYKDTPEYKEKIDELNEEYNIKTELNKLIPQIYQEYIEVYEDFFEKRLPPNELRMEKMILNVHLR